MRWKKPIGLGRCTIKGEKEDEELFTKPLMRIQVVTMDIQDERANKVGRTVVRRTGITSSFEFKMLSN